MEAARARRRSALGLRRVREPIRVPERVNVLEIISDI
jgi:hypothetical protein